MLPKNSKHYIIPTANELDMNAELVQDAVSFFFSELREELMNLTHFNINVDGLGTFKAKEQELPKLYAKYSKHLEVASTDTLKHMRMKKDLEENLRKVVNLQRLMTEEKKRRTKFLKNKYGHNN